MNNCRESTQKPSKPELMEYKYTRDDNVEGEHRMITLIIQISTHANKAKWSFTLCAVGCLQYTEMWLMSTHTCHTHTDLYVICDRFQSQLVFLNLAIICFGLTDVSLCCEFMTSYRVLLVSLIFWVVSCLYCWWILVVTCFFWHLYCKSRILITHFVNYKATWLYRSIFTCRHVVFLYKLTQFTSLGTISVLIFHRAH